MTKFDRNAKKHRNAKMETRRDAETKHATQRCKTQCRTQCTTNMNKWKCQHHQRCYAVNTTIKVCKVQTRTKAQRNKRECVVIEKDNEYTVKHKQET